MTYFGFLARFLILPLILVWGLLWWRRSRGAILPPAFRTWPAWTVIVGHVIVAVIYTTPWDNYLVATAVWWYDPALVTGLTLGYVPIEEYTFFVLQTILTGSWVVWLLGWPALSAPAPGPFRPRPGLRLGATSLVILIWLISTAVLIGGYEPATYMTLILSWALIPVIIQLAFGADILWHYRRLLFWSFVPSTAYLALADALAIQAGTWTISPSQTFGLLLGGILPLEEFTFFLMTNILVSLGVTLVLARLSHARIRRRLPGLTVPSDPARQSS